MSNLLLFAVLNAEGRETKQIPWMRRLKEAQKYSSNTIYCDIIFYAF